VKLCILISDEVFFRPKVLFRLLMNNRDNVCLVAEVRDGNKNMKKEKHLAPLRLWGIRNILRLKMTSLAARIFAMFLPSFSQSCLTNKKVCAFFRVPWMKINSVNDPDFIRHLSSLCPDVVISIQRQILGAGMLAVPKIACINCHPSSLPKYRGFWPVLLAMINGDKTIGVTAHIMTDRIDMGPILARREFATSPRFSLMDNYRLVYELYPEVICEAIDCLKEKKIADLPCVPGDAPYCCGPTAADMERFRAGGLRML